jgi:uncharacterized protein YhfF
VRQHKISGKFVDDHTNLSTFWLAYLSMLPEDAPRPDFMPDAWYFCDNETDANTLAGLVQAGIKTATCSLFWVYAAGNERMPQVGDLSIITDWGGFPLCIIETTEVEIKPYNTVDLKFAYDEGEGDRSLAYWRAAHWRFFSRECVSIGREPAEDMPVVCERFRVIFSPTRESPTRE